MTDGPKRTRRAEEPAPPFGPRRLALTFFALFYLVNVWLDGVGSNLPVRLFPRAWVYFTQIAALFRLAGAKAIDYRAEGYVCSERRWTEIDVRPFFRIDQDNKENRFHRALQFYRRERQVMRALEEFVITHHNAAGHPKIGGVRFSSLRVPYPRRGDHVEPYRRRPLAQYPDDVRHPWYWTPRSHRAERCGLKVREIEDEEAARPGATAEDEPKEVE